MFARSNAVVHQGISALAWWFRLVVSALSVFLVGVGVSVIVSALPTERILSVDILIGAGVATLVALGVAALFGAADPVRHRFRVLLALVNSFFIFLSVLNLEIEMMYGWRLANRTVVLWAALYLALSIAGTILIALGSRLRVRHHRLLAAVPTIALLLLYVRP